MRLLFLFGGFAAIAVKGVDDDDGGVFNFTLGFCTFIYLFIYFIKIAGFWLLL